MPGTNTLAYGHKKFDEIETRRKATIKTVRFILESWNQTGRFIFLHQLIYHKNAFKMCSHRRKNAHENACESGLYLIRHKMEKNAFLILIERATEKVLPGSSVSNGREPKSYLGRVFNYKLGSSTP